MRSLRQSPQEGHGRLELSNGLDAYYPKVRDKVHVSERLVDVEECTALFLEPMCGRVCQLPDLTEVLAIRNNLARMLLLSSIQIQAISTRRP